MKKNLYPLALVPFLFLGTAVTLDAQEFAAPIENPFGLDGTLPDQHIWVRLVDIDGDDTLEAFIFGTNPAFIEYYENEGSNADPQFVQDDYSPFNIEENGVILPWNFVDIDGDCDYDLTYFVFQNNTPLRILINDGSATNPHFENNYTEDPFGITLIVPTYPISHVDGVTPVFADLDMDCDLDLMYNGAINDQVLYGEGYFFSENTGTFYDPSYAPPVRNDYGIGWPGGNYHQSIFVDLDCDGDLDLYTSIVPEYEYRYYENTPDSNGRAQFITPVKFWHPVDSVDFRFSPINGTFFDHGGDGDLDLICGGSSGIHFWENTADNCNYSPPVAGFSFTQDGQVFTFTDESTGNPTCWHWNFGDGEMSSEQNPIHTYTQSGVYNVCLDVPNGITCHYICEEIVVTGTWEESHDVSISLSPNPAQDILQLILRSELILGNATLQIFDPMGRQVFTRDLGTVGTELSETLDASQLPPGVYLLKIDFDKQTLLRKFVKQ